MYIVHTMKLLQNNRIHPILDNERFNLLAFTLDEQTYKTTIKLRIAANGKTHELLFYSTTKLARIGTAWGTGPEALNR